MKVKSMSLIQASGSAVRIDRVRGLVKVSVSGAPPISEELYLDLVAQDFARRLGFKAGLLAERALLLMVDNDR